jgi:hypothetical protein
MGIVTMENGCGPRATGSRKRGFARGNIDMT